MGRNLVLKSQSIEVKTYNTCAVAPISLHNLETTYLGRWEQTPNSSSLVNSHVAKGTAKNTPFKHINPMIQYKSVSDRVLAKSNRKI